MQNIKERTIASWKRSPKVTSKKNNYISQNIEKLMNKRINLLKQGKRNSRIYRH